MANVVTHPHLQVEFHPGPVNHSPSPLGFGFGLSAAPIMSGWTPAPTNMPQVPWNLAMNPPAHLRPTKRRFEPDEDETKSKDDAMERSPTPERPKRAAPKRARTTPMVATGGKDEKRSKENKPPSADDGDDVDVGVLLASLPPQSLLPLLTSLLAAQPSLKSTILSLIPRPALDTAIQALAGSAKNASTSFGFGAGGFASSRSNTPASLTGFGFGRSSPGSSSHSAVQPPIGSNNGGMRDDYILSRLRPHIAEFVSACFSYLPYFSYLATTPTPMADSKPHAHSHVHSHSSALQSQHKDRFHPSETFLFLAALTSHILSQPPLAQSALNPLILPRLTEEWKAWIGHVDGVVSGGGMFGQETVRSWERALDDFAAAKGNGLEVLREIRDQWVSKVGWLVGRQNMEMQ
ncbi:hypothetical protein B0H21DRAFT_740528 [Amylocystis lapponica]|nr:hypothetical protein B0H21DRAFT_740528 [Amylocystis lapponica]